MKEKVSPSILNHTLSFNPWVFFIIFLISNTLLSFYPCSLQLKLLIVLLGLVLPWIIGYKTISQKETKRPTGEDHFSVPLWLWLLLTALIMFTRFYRLTTLPSWFLGDEGYESALGIGLLNHWDWRLLWSPVPHEPLLDWLLGFFFKLSPPSLFSFRLFSALISLATIGAAYWGSRPFLTRRVSFLFAVVLAFSYWAFTLSRLGIVVILIPLIQCASFGFFGRLIQAKSNSARWQAWAGLTATNILGFYTWTNWVGLGLALSFLLFIYYWKNPALPKKHLWGFYIVSASALLPLVLARLAPGGMAHIGETYQFNPLKAFVYYLVGLFWDGSAAANYASLWGGFFNPILSALSLLGVLSFLQRKNSFWRWALPIAALLSFLPALLASGDVELYRSLPIMVFLTLASVNGIHSLYQHSSQKLSAIAVFLLLTASAGMDIYNYALIYCNADQRSDKLEWRSKAYSQAYQTLDQLQQKSGPLYVFSQFTTEYDNQTIDVALYPFNALQNPALNGTHPQWTAVLTNVNYVPFLVKTYPRAQITLFKKPGDPAQSSNYIALIILSTSDIPTNTLSQWKEADSIFRKINLDLLNKNPITPWGNIANDFPPLSQNRKADPLAMAVYWEKMGLFHFQGKNFKEAAEDYRKAIQQGYPAAQLQYNLSLALKSAK